MKIKDVWFYVGFMLPYTTTIQIYNDNLAQQDENHSKSLITHLLNKPTTRLPSFIRSQLGRASSRVASLAPGTAPRGAVGIAEALPSNELLSFPSPDIRRPSRISIDTIHLTCRRVRRRGRRGRSLAECPVDGRLGSGRLCSRRLNTAWSFAHGTIPRRVEAAALLARDVGHGFC